MNVLVPDVGVRTLNDFTRLPGSPLSSVLSFICSSPRRSRRPTPGQLLVGTRRSPLDADGGPHAARTDSRGGRSGIRFSLSNSAIGNWPREMVPPAPNTSQFLVVILVTCTRTLSVPPAGPSSTPAATRNYPSDACVFATSYICFLRQQFGRGECATLTSWKRF